MSATTIEIPTDTDVLTVAYSLTHEPAPGPASITSRPGPKKMLHCPVIPPMQNTPGCWSLTINLSNARSRGLDDAYAIRRIIAIAHPGTVAADHVELVYVIPA